MPRVYYYRLRQQPASALVDAADSGLHYRGQQGKNAECEEGAGVYGRATEEIPNQNQVFSLENEESDDFLEEELPHKKYVEEKERTQLGEELSQTTSSVGEWLQQAWTLLLTIAYLFIATGTFIRKLWTTKTYRYGLLVALLVALFLYFYQPTPTPTVVEVPVAKPGVVVMPGGTTTVVYDDRLPLNVEVFVKRLVEQQLAKKQDDTLSRVMQKLAADKEELKRRSKEELLHYLDDKLGKMDAMIRAHLDTPATIDDSVSKELKELEAKVGSELQHLNEKLGKMDATVRSRLNAPVATATAASPIAAVIDDSVSQELKELEARVESELLRLTREIKSGNDGSAEAKRSLQAQLDALQRRVSELTDSVDSKIEAARLSQEQASVALSDEQLREVVRLVNANQRAVGAQSLGEDQVRELIQKELEVFAADRLNMSDWALGAAGARILHAYTSDRYGSSLLGHLLGQVGEPPSALLTPSLVMGHCWAFPGEQGNATIQLPRRIKPTAFSLDHVSRGVARDFRSAPQHFKVWGYTDKAAVADESKGVLLGEYRYDIYGAQVQTFAVQPDAQLDAEQSFSVVKLAVSSNYGHEDFTCVYRFRVHGDAV